MMKAVLFDYDGTIMDTEPAIMASYRHLFRTYRTEEEFTEELQTAVLGPSLNEMAEKLFPDRDPDQMVEEYRVYQRTKAMDLIHLMPGATELLQLLKAASIPVGLVSARVTDSMQRHLRHFNLEGCFDTVVGQDMVRNGKPDPEGIHLALSRLNLRASDGEMFYIGDSITDIAAGKNAGISTIGFVSNRRKEEALRNARPDYLTDSLYDAAEFLKHHI